MQPEVAIHVHRSRRQKPYATLCTNPLVVGCMSDPRPGMARFRDIFVDTKLRTTIGERQMLDKCSASAWSFLVIPGLLSLKTHFARSCFDVT